MVARQGLYAYGLVGKRPEHLDIVGIDKQHKVYPVSGRDMCVIVSAIDIDEFQKRVEHAFSALTKTAGVAQSGTGAILQAHEDVVDTLMQDTAVVPFKFGTILKDEEAASRLLQDEGEKFKQLLAKCSGREEWGLKVYVDKQALKKHRMQVDPAFKTLGETREKLPRGVAYLLGRKIEEEIKGAIAAQLTEVTEHIFQELANDVYEAKLNKTLPQQLTGKEQEMILNAVYLVEKERIARFCEHATRLREQYEVMGIGLEVSGPWPPYNFT